MRMKTAHINRIAIGLPPHDVHAAFVRYALSLLENNVHSAAILRRMIDNPKSLSWRDATIA
jgi:hypothetical protein